MKRLKYNGKCIGFGDKEGKCDNKPGTQWSDYWCDDCDADRRVTVRKQLEAIKKHMDDAGGDNHD